MHQYAAVFADLMSPCCCSLWTVPRRLLVVVCCLCSRERARHATLVRPRHGLRGFPNRTVPGRRFPTAYLILASRILKQASRDQRLEHWPKHSTAPHGTAPCLRRARYVEGTPGKSELIVRTPTGWDGNVPALPAGGVVIIAGKNKVGERNGALGPLMQLTTTRDDGSDKV